jgi:hypothetical protein
VKSGKRDNDQREREGETMNATHNTNSLAAAFANATARRAPQRPVAAPQRAESRPTTLTEDELLLAVLRHSLTPADKFIARRTLLRAAPWEDALG